MGAARVDAASGRHVAGDALRWTADRPACGEAVLVEGTTAYAYGCRASGFPSGERFVARAPIERLDDRRAYAYARGAGHWALDADGAFPLFTGAASIILQKGEQVPGGAPIPTFTPVSAERALPTTTNPTAARGHIRESCGAASGSLKAAL